MSNVLEIMPNRGCLFGLAMLIPVSLKVDQCCGFTLFVKSVKLYFL